MDFFDEQFPPCYSFGASGGPMFSTEATLATGGERFAIKNWTMPLHAWNISSGIKSQADFEVYREFFYNVAGQYSGFRFKDWLDFEVTAQPAAQISGGTFQLQRAYVRGVRTFLRTIYKPVSGTVSVVRTRAGVPAGISPSIDFTTGQFTDSTHVAGDSYTWSGQFDVPVAFISDIMEATIQDKNRGGLLVEWPQVSVRELRNP